MKRIYGVSLAALLLLLSCVGALNAQSAQDQVYRLKPGDELGIYVHENNDLTMTVSVLPDGTISYPLVGSLYVQGLTTSGLQDILTQKLSSFLQKPVVVVTISSQTLYNIYVMGAVRAPHGYSYYSGKKVTDYLAEAGGPDETANLTRCYIYPVDSKVPRKVINLKKILDDVDRAENIELQPNELIYLEPRSGFAVINWQQIGQIFSMVTGIVTLWLISERNR
jgi:polysaccharide export outer membrane protein